MLAEREKKFMRQIPERDWKILRTLKDPLIQKYCDEILNELDSIIQNRGNKSHKDYLEIWKILEKRDSELSSLFDDFKRSTAFFKLASWKSHGLITKSDLSKFSNETKEMIKLINSK